VIQHSGVLEPEAPVLDDRPMRTQITLICISLVASPVMIGCASSEELSTGTSCRDFLQAPVAEQNAAIARVADELGTRNALTPLGRPNIDYLCSTDQDRTLGEVVEATG
jgi:hypothetical protein